MHEHRPRLGYIIGSHVVYHKAVAQLLQSMADNKIDPATIIVQVNGEDRLWHKIVEGVNYYYVTGAVKSHFWSLVNFELGKKFDIQYWLYLNCTSKCGPEFKIKAEAGFNPDADATLAGAALPLAECGECRHGRAINDLAVYKYDYLLTQKDAIEAVEHANAHDIYHRWEGYFYGAAPIQASYPQLGYTIGRDKLEDVYGTGVMRATEYYPGIDWYRYKRNFGQLSDQPDGYNRAAM